MFPKDTKPEPRGSYLPLHSEDADRNLLEEYAQAGSATALAARYGVASRTMRERVAAAKTRLNDIPMMVERLHSDTENLIQHELDLSSVPLEGSQIKQVWIKGKHLSLNMAPDKAEQQAPKWPVVQQAAPTVVQYMPHVWVRNKIRTEVVLPDTQIGYQRMLDTRQQNGNLESYSLLPMHDEAALDVALQVTASVRPAGVTHVGDLMDFSEFSRYLQVEAFFRTTQPALDRAHRLLADLRSIVGPAGKIRLVDGNHDEKRIATYIQMNARAAFGLRQANTPVETDADMTMAHLLRFDELGIEVAGMWPGSQHWLVTGKHPLVVVHDPQQKGRWQASVISGHTHHRREESYIQQTQDGQQSYTHYEIGCLCAVKPNPDPRSIQRTRVPSDRGIVTGWQQGLAVVEILEETGEHRLDFIPINNGRAIYRGQVFTSSVVR